MVRNYIYLCVVNEDTCLSDLLKKQIYPGFSDSEPSILWVSVYHSDAVILIYFCYTDTEKYVTYHDPWK